MPKLFNELAFHPSINEIVPQSASGSVTIFTGSNNSGKSAYLKKTIDDVRKLYIGVNRFYSFHNLGFYGGDAGERDQWYFNMQLQRSQQYQNFEGSFFNCSTAITRLTNEKRSVLFQTFTSLFGIPIEVLSENPGNDFSNRYVAVDGDSLSVTSSGTRLFLGVLAALMDERFSSVVIDEPELGLSPNLQKRLADIIIRGNHKASLFPHNPNIVISTHSHLFLDKMVPGNNWIVQKSGNLISARQCASFPEIQDIQFRLLGNDLGELFLPDAVIFVEGETDKTYLENVMRIHAADLTVIVQACNGDIASRLTYWSSSLGDMQLSPYRTRTFIVYDRVKQSGIERACDRAGIPIAHRVEWDGNGIEYVYPDDILSSIYRSAGLSPSRLTIENDEVSFGEISYKKMELCRKVCEIISTATVLPQELRIKFLQPIQAISHTTNKVV